MNDNIPFSHLRKILLDRGFVEKIVPGSHLLFEHAATGTLLFYHEYQAGDCVSWNDHVKTRRFLDERGILDGDVFESLLQSELV